MPRPSPSRSLPTFIKPMLASRGTAFDDDADLFEIKWNGIRMLAFIETPLSPHESARGNLYKRIHTIPPLPPVFLLFCAISINY